MRAFLPVSVKFARFRPNQNCRIFFRRIVEIERGVESKALGSFDASRRQSFSLPRIDRGLCGETCSANKEPRRGQSQEVAELTSSNLCFFAVLVWKLALMRRSRATHITFIMYNVFAHLQNSLLWLDSSTCVSIHEVDCGSSLGACVSIPSNTPQPSTFTSSTSAGIIKYTFVSTRWLPNT